ncbi:hypothetical protein A6V39_00965 [Candidatus Mycoplasma haematobovis]|uniref:Uncharacterized protein n=1 Tax=Candidatus Mycoplasma haematobovis TaxID=432608 RepID=A0A1A9QDS5_9MOLU|nr:hypothetical protein [Candidatus Mycoplasma haematobovis]OAL10623.1 hypothetical protein A6V39_00965 [Candidatus Mycoplasma haematobovis]
MFIWLSKTSLGVLAGALSITGLSLVHSLKIPTIKEEMLNSRRVPFEGNWNIKFISMKKRPWFNNLEQALKKENPNLSYSDMEKNGGNLLEKWCKSFWNEKISFNKEEKTLSNAKKWCSTT